MLNTKEKFALELISSNYKHYQKNHDYNPNRKFIFAIKITDDNSAMSKAENSAIKYLLDNEYVEIYNEFSFTSYCITDKGIDFINANT